MKLRLNLIPTIFVSILALSASFQALAKAPQPHAPEKLVVEFYDKVFVQRGNDIRAVSEQYLHENYIQHNPYVATGREAFIKAIGGWLKKKPASAQTVIKRVIAAGDYVVLHIHSYDSTKEKPGKAGVDIFRVENGKIIEHWDVWQTIPEEMPHTNGMF